MINNCKINITAHAGCMNASMDSIEAVEAGIKYGADIIEIDLNVDKDNNLILSHNRPKEGIQYSEFSTVLEIIKNQKDILLNVDVKNTLTLRWLRNIISEYELLDKVFLTGLTMEDIVENKEFLKSINYFINLGIFDLENNTIEKLIDKIKYLDVIGININYNFLTSELVTACKERKMITSVWTVDEPEDMEKVIGLKVNSITTKRIDVLKNIIKKIMT